MQINVSQLLREHIGSTRDYEIDEDCTTSEDNSQPVRGKCTLLRTQRGILAKCRVKTVIELGCSRCLRQYRQPLTLNIEEEYLPTVDVLSGAPLPPAEDGDLTIDEHHILNLADAISQYTLMAVPMKPLCSKDCAGLCPDCGRDLNQGPCGCPVETMDPRWSALTKLL